MDDDALEVEVNPGPAWDQFDSMLGSGSSANRARHMELAGKSLSAVADVAKRDAMHKFGHHL